MTHVRFCVKKVLQYCTVHAVSFALFGFETLRIGKHGSYSSHKLVAYRT